MSICICIYKDKGFRLYIHNNKNAINYYTKSNKQSLKCLSSSDLKTLAKGELTIDWDKQFQSLITLLL